MNIKTISLEDFVNFVDTTTKKNTYLSKIITLIASIIVLFSFFVLFKYLNE